MAPFTVPLSQTAPAVMTPDEVDRFARRIGWIDDIGVIQPESTSIQTQPLDWWPGRTLILAADPAWNGTMGAWINDGKLHRLDGTSPPIHETNARTRAEISSENALAYLGFFCTFVHGEDGPFYIVSDLDDANLPAGLDRDKVAPFLRPATLLKSDEKGHHIEAIVFYSDALFLSNFVVAPSGMCEMIEDEPLLQELGAKVHMPLRFLPPAAEDAPADGEADGN